MHEGNTMPKSKATVASLPATSGRLIGLQHRVKKTAKGEARPTILALLSLNGRFQKVELETEQEELDFLLRRGDFEDSGYQKGDRVVTILGGSGNAFIHALSRHGEDIGAEVHRVPGYRLKELRDSCADWGATILLLDVLEDSDGPPSDAMLLIHLWHTNAKLFYHCGPRDREQMLLAIRRREHREAQQERIKAGNRLCARAIGKCFYSEENRYPEGALEEMAEREKTSDALCLALLAEEFQRKKELDRTYRHSYLHPLLSQVTGIGGSIAGDIVATIGDIRRFRSASALKAFAGVHVLGADGRPMPKGTDPRKVEGKFARRRVNQLSNWNPQLHQALFQLGDQFNRRPDSLWGKKLIENKKKLREKHPFTEVVVRDKDGLVTAVYPLKPEQFERKGKHYRILLDSGEYVEAVGTQRYYDGHIHKMAIWRTLSQFVEWLYGEWSRYDKKIREVSSVETGGKKESIAA